MRVCGAVFYQDQVAKRVKEAVSQLREGQLLSRRPFQVTWFASQVAICLGLWEYNRTLNRALDLGKAFLIPLEALNAIWPCPGVSRFLDLRLASHGDVSTDVVRFCLRTAQPPAGPPPQA